MPSGSGRPSPSNCRSRFDLCGVIMSHFLLFFAHHLIFALAQEISDIPDYQSLPSCVISGLSAVLTPGGVPNPDCVATITAPVSIASCACLEYQDSVAVNNMVYDGAYWCDQPDGIPMGEMAEGAFGEYCSLFQKSFAVILASATATFSSFDYQVTNLPGFFGIPRCARSAMVSTFEPGGFAMCPTVTNPSSIASCACYSETGLPYVYAVAGGLGNGCLSYGEDGAEIDAVFSSYCALYTRQANLAKASSAAVANTSPIVLGV
jgi:hypothetical protein